MRRRLRTVRQGDTLWDISGQFLDEPWRWQEIWQGNPEVKNPNLIYPGDLLRLSFEAGKPVVRVARKGRPVVKLSPKVRSLPARAGSYSHRSNRCHRTFPQPSSGRW